MQKTHFPEMYRPIEKPKYDSPLSSQEESKISQFFEGFAEGVSGQTNIKTKLDEVLKKKFHIYPHEKKELKACIKSFFIENLALRLDPDIEIENKFDPVLFQKCKYDLWSTSIAGFSVLFTNLKITKIALEKLAVKTIKPSSENQQYKDIINPAILYLEEFENDTAFKLLTEKSWLSKKPWPSDILINEVHKGAMELVLSEKQLQHIFNEALKELINRRLSLQEIPSLHFGIAYLPKAPNEIKIPKLSTEDLFRNLEFEEREQKTHNGLFKTQEIKIRCGSLFFTQDAQMFLETVPRTLPEYIQQLLLALGTTSELYKIHDFLSFTDPLESKNFRLFLEQHPEFQKIYYTGFQAFPGELISKHFSNFYNCHSDTHKLFSFSKQGIITFSYRYSILAKTSSPIEGILNYHPQCNEIIVFSKTPQRSLSMQTVRPDSKTLNPKSKSDLSTKPDHHTKIKKNEITPNTPDTFPPVEMYKLQTSNLFKSTSEIAKVWFDLKIDLNHYESNVLVPIQTLTANHLIFNPFAKFEDRGKVSELLSKLFQ